MIVVVILSIEMFLNSRIFKYAFNLLDLILFVIVYFWIDTWYHGFKSVIRPVNIKANYGSQNALLCFKYANSRWYTSKYIPYLNLDSS